MTHPLLSQTNGQQKQSIWCHPLCKPAGFHLICRLHIVYQPGGVLYGTRPLRVHLRGTLLPHPPVEALRPDAVCGSLAHTALLPSRRRFSRAGCYLDAYLPCGCEGLPAPEWRRCADAPARRLPAHLGGRPRLLDLYF